MESTAKTPEVVNIDVDPENPVSEIESLCMNCHETGTTRILMTKIPFFKELIIMSFSCPHCGHRSNEVEPAAGLSDTGGHIIVTVVNSKDMNRKVIKSNFATIKVECCGLEIPPNTQKGKLTTIEGFLSTTKEHFTTSLQDGLYSEMGDEFISKIKDGIQKLTDTLEGKNFPFEFSLDDPSGNSFIENPFAPQTDQNVKLKYYERTREMCESIGYLYENTETTKNDTTQNIGEKKIKNQFVNPSYYDKKKEFTVYKANSEISNKIVDFTKSIDDNDILSLRDDTMNFDTDCYCCHKPGQMHSCICTIPYFKEIVITCFKCEFCGYKTTEVKGGGGISEKGMKLTLNVDSAKDLNRDIFKSESSSIIIPEIGFESSDGSLGSMFTTVEGVLDKIGNNLENLPFTYGDSNDNKQGMTAFISKIKDCQTLKTKFTLIIDDPLDNSFIFPEGDNPETDTKLKKEPYERTFEQNEDGGINDMNVNENN